jgi:hypothetical protein
MFDKIKLWIRNFKLNNFINSALRGDIIVVKNDVVGINANVFVYFMKIIPSNVKDEFVDRIVNLVIDKKMDLEIEKENIRLSLEKIKEFIINDDSKNYDLPVGNAMYYGKKR